MLGLAMPANVVQTLLGVLVLAIVVLMFTAKKSEFPDVQQPEAVAGEQQCGEGGAHAVEGCVAVDHVAQMRVGTNGGLAQGGQQVGAGGVLVEGRERGDSDRAGDLSGGVPAHPVGDREQPGAGVDAVLVPGTQQPDVRQRGVAQRQGHLAARLIAAAQGRSCRS